MCVCVCVCVYAVLEIDGVALQNANYLWGNSESFWKVNCKAAANHYYS